MVHYPTMLEDGTKEKPYFIGKQHSKYSYSAKNSGKDLIYRTRLKIIYKMELNEHSSSKMYALFMDAYLGIVLN